MPRRKRPRLLRTLRETVLRTTNAPFLAGGKMDRRVVATLEMEHEGKTYFEMQAFDFVEGELRVTQHATEEEALAAHDQAAHEFA